MGKAQKWGIGIAVVIALSIVASFLPEDTSKQEAEVQQQQQFDQLAALVQLAPEEAAHGFTRDINVTKGRVSIIDTAPEKLQVNLHISKGYSEEVIKEIINNLSAGGFNPKQEGISISMRLVSKGKSVTGNEQTTSFGRYRYSPSTDSIEWVNGAD